MRTANACASASEPEIGDVARTCRHLGDGRIELGRCDRKIALRRCEQAPGRGESCLSQRNIRPRDLTDLETVLCRAELLRDQAHVAFPQLHELARAQHVHVGLNTPQKNGLLDPAQRLSGAEDNFFLRLDAQIADTAVIKRQAA